MLSLNFDTQETLERKRNKALREISNGALFWGRTIHFKMHQWGYADLKFAQCHLDRKGL